MIKYAATPINIKKRITKNAVITTTLLGDSGSDIFPPYFIIIIFSVFSFKFHLLLFSLYQVNTHHLAPEKSDFIKSSYQFFSKLFQSIHNHDFHALLESNQRRSNGLT